MSGAFQIPSGSISIRRVDTLRYTFHCFRMDPTDWIVERRSVRGFGMIYADVEQLKDNCA